MTARLPSHPERMVPGAPVLLEPCLAIQHKMLEQEGWKAQRGTVRIKRKWGKCGSGAALAATWCLRFSSFLGAALGKLVPTHSEQNANCLTILEGHGWHWTEGCLM